MIDDSKRNLRVRKNPKYLNSDVFQLSTQQQDPDKVSFSQLKSHHDYSSTHTQKAQDAKILSKLINKINKSYRTYLNQTQHNVIEAEKTQPTPKQKKTQAIQQTAKKYTYTAKQTKKQKQPQQRPKSTYNFKNQYQSIKQQQTLKNTQSYINQLKQMGSLPTIQGIGKGLFTDQLKKLQTLYPDMKNITYQNLTQNTNPNLFSSQTSQKKKQPLQPQKNVFAEEKLFKRSAYHVAIAYHIYLKNLKQKGGVIGNQIDPTYHAKKLKEGRPMME